MDSSTQAARPGKTVFPILAVISFCHLLNDMMQSLIPAIYPLLTSASYMYFGQVGMITLSSQLTASLLQPVVGAYTDRRPKPYSLTIGMCFTLFGLLVLSRAPSFAMVLFAVATVGVGSAVFHPESSRVARMASGGQPGLAQSLFQVGGNAGSALGPLLAAFIVLRRGQSSISWFSLAALLALVVLANVGAWYKKIGPVQRKVRTDSTDRHKVLSTPRIAIAIAILLALIFS
jgi:FSR family fosmidomycin resistance protein-like MFS transporter